LSLLDHLHKVLSQLIEFLEISSGLADALNERSLVCRELLLVFNEQPGRVQDACRGETTLDRRSCLSFLATYPLRWLRQARPSVACELPD
jgi:hypothetical protein